MPRVSVITASYCYEKLIGETIESVIAQSFTDWEMIIVDDGSKDNSVEVIKKYCEKDGRIKLYTHENSENRGLKETLKLGLSAAQGDLIVFLESDDTITPNYIEEKLKIFEKYPEVKFVFNDVNLFGNAERIKDYDGYFKTIRKVLNNTKFPAMPAILFLSVYDKIYNIVPTFSCVMCSKEIFDDIDLDSPLPECLDVYLWSQIGAKYEFYFIPKLLTNWRIHPDSYLNRKKNTPEKVLDFKYNVILNNLYAGKPPLKGKYLYIKEWLKTKRREAIKFHLKDGELYLFGKLYKIGK